MAKYNKSYSVEELHRQAAGLRQRAQLVAHLHIVLRRTFWAPVDEEPEGRVRDRDGLSVPPRRDVVEKLLSELMREAGDCVEAAERLEQTRVSRVRARPVADDWEDE